QQVGQLRVERRHLPRADAPGAAAAGTGLGQVDAHRVQAAGVEHRQRLALVAGGPEPLAALAGGAQGGVAEGRRRLDSKTEIRNSKSETNPKSEEANPKQRTLAFRSFPLWILGLFRISDFEFRISS